MRKRFHRCLCLLFAVAVICGTVIPTTDTWGKAFEYGLGSYDKDGNFVDIFRKLATNPGDSTFFTYDNESTKKVVTVYTHDAKGKIHKYQSGSKIPMSELRNGAYYKVNAKGIGTNTGYVSSIIVCKDYSQKKYSDLPFEWKSIVANSSNKELWRYLKYGGGADEFSCLHDMGTVLPIEPSDFFSMALVSGGGGKQCFLYQGFTIAVSKMDSNGDYDDTAYLNSFDIKWDIKPNANGDFEPKTTTTTHKWTFDVDCENATFTIKYKLKDDKYFPADYFGDGSPEVTFTDKDGHYYSINKISDKDGVLKFYVQNIEAGDYTLKIKHYKCTKIKKVTCKATPAEKEEEKEEETTSTDDTYWDDEWDDYDPEWDDDYSDEDDEW